MTKCDVIVPIYNAYECVIECVESVLKYTDLKENRLILINDKSTDDRIMPLLNKYKKKYKDLIVLENTENKGFVGTVNVGMQLSDKNDVLLLNSDTVVTPNWLDYIKKCAYSGSKIATVTPLSNNATMASVPVPFKKNELPNSLTINDMAKIVDECSYFSYPDLPTGHGFCLYIKRDVLNKLGYFDEVTFGKGYGEENDFCFRCLDCGYRHLLCDNAYVFHKESQSFSDSKIALMHSGEEALKKRYPVYTERLNAWCRAFPLKYIGDNIAFAMRDKKNLKRNILIIIHDFHDVENHLGGTTLHVYDIIKKLRHKYNFHVLAPVDNTYHLTSYWTNSVSHLTFPHFYDSRSYQSYNNDYYNIVEEIVKNFAIDGIHVHHMMYHYFDLVEIIKKYHLWTTVSLHDFYSVCPLTNKMYCHKSYCGEGTVEQCRECLARTLNFKQNMIQDWRGMWQGLFNVSNHIIAPTASCKEEIKKTFKDLKIQIIEHGIDIKKVNERLNINDQNEQFQVAFLGAIGVIKGSDILYDILTEKRVTNFKLHLFGKFDRIFTKKMLKKITDHGQYKREELPSLLRENNIKLICLLSICPETYSYTLTEAIACGIPVLVSNVGGALKERVEKDNLGWVVDLNQTDRAQAVLDKINEILSNPKDYEEKIESIAKYKIRTVSEMCKDYDKLYNEIEKSKRVINGDWISKAIRKNDSYVSYVSYADYSWVFDTLKWRLISKIKIPTRIKKIFRRGKND